MTRLLFLLTIFSLLSFLVKAQTCTFSGKIMNEANRETIEGVTVLIQNQNTKDLYLGLTQSDGKYFIETDVSLGNRDSLLISVFSYCHDNEVQYSKHFIPQNALTIMDFTICRDFKDDCFAGFSYLFSDNNQVNFFGNYTKDSNVIWKFGDGQSSGRFHPQHTYENNGKYEVTLTVSNEYCTQSYSRFIDVGNTYKLSGTVWMGENKLQDGSLLLMGNNNKGASSISQVQNLQNGNFRFNQLSPGAYLAYAIPSVSGYPYVYPRYLPTYAGETIKWSDAKLINCNQNIGDFELHLVSYPFPYYGNCSLSGKVDLENALSYEGFVIYLLNNRHEPINFTVPNWRTGIFTFEDLPKGTYYVMPERAGVFSTEREITLKDEEPEIVELDYVIEEGKLVEKEKEEQNELVFDLTFKLRYKTIYMNLDEDFNHDVVCELYDVLGRTVFQEKANGPEIVLDVNSIKSGVYFFAIKTYSGDFLFQKKIFLSN